MTEKNLKKHTISQNKYDSRNSIRVSLNFNTTTDAPILAMLHQVPSMSGYIRSVLFEDIRRNNPDLLKITRFEKASDSVSFGRTSPNPSDTLILPTSNSRSNPTKKKNTED